MRKTSPVIGLALGLSVMATTCMAAAGDSGGTGSSQSVTQPGDPPVSTPATPPAGAVTANPNNGKFPATVGPTGSTQPDATNPERSQPAGGGKGG